MEREPKVPTGESTSLRDERCDCNINYVSKVPGTCAIDVDSLVYIALLVQLVTIF